MLVICEQFFVEAQVGVASAVDWMKLIDMDPNLQLQTFTLPETNNSPLKIGAIDPWKPGDSELGFTTIFRGKNAVSFRYGTWLRVGVKSQKFGG